jgi:hypothetical protein
VKGFSCLGAAVHCVRDDSADFGIYVRRSTAAQYAATKATTKVTTKYPIQRSAASIGFLTARASFEPPLLQVGYVRWSATFGK